MSQLRRTMGWIAVTTLAACGGGRPSPSSAPAPTSAEASAAPAAVEPDARVTSAPDWLHVDSIGKVATLTLEVTAPPASPSALINGYRAGEVRVVIPRDWKVSWSWHSADSTNPHSLVVMVQREKIPLEGGRPAFSNAMTRMVSEGLRPGQSDRTTFAADEPGWYWMLCGVPSHALKGEWIELRVDPEARLPAIVVKDKK